MGRIILLSGLFIALATGSAAAAGNAAKGKKAGHGIRGVVETVTTDVGKDGGTIVVRVQRKKKGAANTTAVERKVKVTPATKVSFVRGKKGAREETPATFADVKAGDRVAVVGPAGKGHQAQKVLIYRGKKRT